MELYFLILFILLIIVLLLIRRKEHFYEDIPVNPFYEGITIDLLKSQMDIILNEELKGKIIVRNLDSSIDKKYVYENETSEDKRLKELLDKENPIDRKVKSNSHILKLIDIISETSKIFVDPDMSYINNETKQYFLTTNYELLSIQNSYSYSLIASSILEKRDLIIDNAQRYKFYIKIKKHMASTYFYIELTMDVYNDKRYRILDIHKVEKNSLMSIIKRSFLEDTIDNGINCYHDKCTNLMPRESPRVFYKNKLYRELRRIDSHNFTCTTKDTHDPVTCASKELFPDGTIEEAGTLYRNKCVSDFQCPMWKANKNYPNNRGKCVGGLCEFPIGLPPISATNYDKNYKALCHKRKGGFETCDKQKNVTDLESPDYAFPNDFNDRLVYYKELKNKGLPVQNLFQLNSV